MDTLTRRRFLIASGVAGAGALAAGATAYALSELLATAGERDPRSRILVLVTLYGGNDGLNTVIPYADPAYQDARPDLAYQADEVHRLDDEVGLNPALGGLRELFGAGRLAIVRGVGYPKPDRSHFRSMDGFDTHVDERYLQEVLLGQVDRALTDFVKRMGSSAAGRGVVVAVYSEFGRRVRANASDGTDHGTASDFLLLGAGVRGGLHGERPSLTDLDDGDLKFTTDFRDVYATLLDRVLDSDPGPVLRGWSGRVDGLFEPV